MQTTQPRTVALAEEMLQVLPSAGWRRCLSLAREYHDPGKKVNRNIIGAYGISHEQFILSIASAYIRHNFTDYDSRVNARVLGYRVPELQECARRAVQPQVNHYLNQWRELP